jgi:hypothetical protein
LGEGEGVERGQMAGRGGFHRKFWLITDGGALSLACTSSEMIGRRGRLCGAARCAESREQTSGVGGCLFCAEMGRVQSHGRENGARRGVCGAPDGCIGAAA